LEGTQAEGALPFDWGVTVGPGSTATLQLHRQQMTASWKPYFFCFQGMHRQQRSLRQRQHGVMWHSMQRRRWQQRQQPRAACFLQKLKATFCPWKHHFRTAEQYKK
jgi:hypothetical protein